MIPILIHAQPLDKRTGERVDIRAGSAGEGTALGLGGVTWNPMVRRRPRIAQGLMTAELDGAFQVARADTVLRLSGYVSDPDRLVWDGAPLTIYRVNDLAWELRRVEFAGIINSHPIAQDGWVVTLNAAGDMARLAKPLLTEEFTGGGGATGMPEMRGTLRPAGFGYCENIEAVWFDPVNNIGQLDGYGNTIAVHNYLEGLSDFGPPQGNYASYAALKAAIVAKTVKPGQWATCVAEGLVGLGAPPAAPYRPTFHATFGTNRPGAMMRRWIENAKHAAIAADQVHAASFAAIDAAVAKDVRIHLRNQVDVVDLIQQMCRSINATPLVMLDNRIGVTRGLLATASGTLNRNKSSTPRIYDWQLADPVAPVWRAVMRAARPGVVLDDTEVNYVDDLVDMGLWDVDETYRNGHFVWKPDGSQWLYQFATPSKGNPLPASTVVQNQWWYRRKPAQTAADFTYANGDTFESLKPAQPGADVTNDHIADGIKNQSPIAVDHDAQARILAMRGDNLVRGAMLEEGSTPFDFYYGAGYVDSHSYLDFPTPNALIFHGNGVQSHIYANNGASLPIVGRKVSVSAWIQNGSQATQLRLGLRLEHRDGSFTYPYVTIFLAAGYNGYRGGTINLPATVRRVTPFLERPGAGDGTWVTAWRVAFAEVGATVGADVNTNVVDSNSGAPVPVTRGDLITTLGISDGFKDQGLLSKLNSLAFGSTFLTNFGALAGLPNLWFGSANLLEGPAGAIATLAAFKTIEGMADGIKFQGPGATAPANRVMNDRTVAGITKIAQPDGATNWLVNNEPGQIQIVLPHGHASGAMVRFDVVVSDLREQKMATRYTISGYLYATDQRWIFCQVNAVGPRAAALPVKLGHYNGKAYVWIGNVGTPWYYAAVSVENVVVRNSAQDFTSGWSVSMNNTNISSLVEYTEAAPRPGDAVFGEGILESAAGTLATLSGFKTILGMADGFVGQGELSKLNSLAYGNPRLTGFGVVSTYTHIRFGGASGTMGGILTENNAFAMDVTYMTILGIADGIVNQGWGAKASEDAASNAKVSIPNHVVDSDFSRGRLAYRWPDFGSSWGVATNYPGYFGRRNLLYGRWGPALAAGATREIVTPGGLGTTAYGSGIHENAFAMPVKPGDRIAAHALIGRHRCRAQVLALISDKDGNLCEAPSAEGGVVGGGFGGDNMGDPLGFTWPVSHANAAYCQLMFRMIGTGETNPFIFIGEPMLAKIPAGQTALPKYQSGRADPRADVTTEQPVVSKLNPDTGRVIDGRSLNSSNNFGLRSLADTATITVSAAGSSCTAQIGAMAYYTDWGTTITFPSDTIPGLAYNTRYYFWRNQPDPAGAGSSWGWSTDMRQAVGTGKVYVGNRLTPASAAAPPPPPPPSPAPGEECVAAFAWVETRDRGYVRARDVVEGDYLRLLAPDRESTVWGRCNGNHVARSYAVRIETETGVGLTLSITTPITLHDGSVVLAPNAWLHRVPVFVDDRLRWETCGVVAAGEIEVAHIRCSNGTYAAGDVAGRAILTHNPYHKP